MQGTSLIRIAQLVDDTTSEGPGRRFAIWVQGCPLRCEGCCNPEMHPFEGGEELSVKALLARIEATPQIEGITLLGGEPFTQPAPLAELCVHLAAKGLSVMIFTGYRWNELLSLADRTPQVSALLKLADLIVDGRYEKALPEKKRRWIGSSNQRVHFLTDRYSPADRRFLEENTIEIRFEGGAISVNGWPSEELCP